MGSNRLVPWFLGPAGQHNSLHYLHQFMYTFTCCWWQATTLQPELPMFRPLVPVSLLTQKSNTRRHCSNESASPVEALKGFCSNVCLRIQLADQRRLNQRGGLSPWVVLQASMVPKVPKGRVTPYREVSDISWLCGNASSFSSLIHCRLNQKPAEH